MSSGLDRVESGESRSEPIGRWRTCRLLSWRWPDDVSSSPDLLRLGGLVVFRIVFPVVAVVVIAVAHVLTDLVQYYSNHIGLNALQAVENACDGIAGGLAGHGDDHDSI